MKRLKLSSVFNTRIFFFPPQTVAPWERRCFPLPEDPAPEPESESDHQVRPRMRSISGCRAMAYGRLDSDDAEPPLDDENSGGALKHKSSTHR